MNNEQDLHQVLSKPLEQITDAELSMLLDNEQIRQRFEQFRMQKLVQQVNWERMYANQ